MTAPENFGHLNGKGWRTKKIDEWKFHSPIPLDGPQAAKLGPPIAHVNMVREFGARESDKFTFVASSKWFKDIHSRSLVDLEAKVKDAFQLAQLAVSELKWSEWIEVRIEGTSDEGDDETEFENHKRKPIGKRGDLSISYKVIKRATAPDGRDLLLEHGGWDMSEFPKPKLRGKEGNWKAGKYTQHDDAQYAYIPSTPESLAALDMIILSIANSRAKLEHFLAQKMIKATLASVPTIPLLTAKP